MLRLSTLSCFLLYVFLCTIGRRFVFFIPSAGCYRCLQSGSQVSLMAPVTTLVIWLQLHGSFIRPQDNQLPQEALAQVLLPIMSLNTGLSLSFSGMLFHVSLSWKSDSPSQLVVSQLDQAYQVQNPILLRQFMQVRLLERNFEFIIFNHIQEIKIH